MSGFGFVRDLAPEHVALQSTHVYCVFVVEVDAHSACALIVWRFPAS
jgi:hypothetical protein